MDDEENDLPPMLVGTTSESAVASAEPNLVPVTVLTGFLGAGKTTLLQRLLTEQCSRRYAVIMNEMAPGSGSVESAFFQAVNREKARQSETSSEESSMLSALSDWIDLPGGCLCCAKNAGLMAIERLIERRKDIDHILIETSGVADPYSLISTFWTDPEMKSCVRLNGVITVVDARNARNWLVDEYTSESSGLAAQSAAKHGDETSDVDLRRVFWNQISLCDLLILNKLDLLSDKQESAKTVGESDVLKQVESRLRVVNPFARLERCSFAQIDAIGDLLDSLRAYDLSTITELRRNSVFSTTDSHSAHGNDDHSHVKLQAAKIVFKRSECDAYAVFDKDRLQNLLSRLVWDAPTLPTGHQRIVRMKAMALVSAAESTLTWFYVQAVNELLDENEVTAQESDGAQLELGMFVFIGYELNEEQLRSELRSCISS